MEVMFTTHPKDGVGRFYMALANQLEWAEVRDDLNYVESLGVLSDASALLLSELRSWGT